MDPFGCIEEECGRISESQEELLARAPFLNDPPSATGDPPIFLSSSDANADAAPPMPPADAPIRICSPPPSPPRAPAPSPVAERPVSCPPLSAGDCRGSSKNKKSVARRRRSGGVRIDTDAVEPSPEPTKENPADIDKYRYQSLELLKDALATRKLPASILNPPAEEGVASEGNQRQTGQSGAGSSGSGDGTAPVFPATLLDVIKAFSAKPNRRYTDADILEIAKMKGIEFPKPKWWRPEGYELKSEKGPK